MATTMSRMTRVMWITAALIGAGCNNFNIQDPNQPLLNSITQNPNRANMATFAAGLFD
jgi:hypothetical protein